jgi:hypothetical protein
MFRNFSRFSFCLCLAALLALSVSLINCGDDDDDDANDSLNDDIDDDADDDDADDDDFDENNLDLDIYSGDSEHYGIACGDETIAVLGTDGWISQEADGYTFKRCYAFSRDTFYLAGSKENQYAVFRLYNGEMEDLAFPGELNHNFINWQPMIFFNENLGYVGSYEYRDGAWTDLGFSRWDVHADSDGLVIDESDGCLYHWDAAQLELVSCPADHPLSDTPDAFFEFREVQYNGTGDAWVSLWGNEEVGMRFSHWNGASWENTVQVAMTGPTIMTSHVWDVKAASIGFAVTQDFSGEEKFRSGFYQLVSGQWQWSPRVNPVNGRGGSSVAVSNVSASEAWIVRYLEIGAYEGNPPEYFEYYLDQYSDGEHFFWEMKDLGYDNIRDLDIRIGD